MKAYHFDKHGNYMYNILCKTRDTFLANYILNHNGGMVIFAQNLNEAVDMLHKEQLKERLSNVDKICVAVTVFSLAEFLLNLT